MKNLQVEWIDFSKQHADFSEKKHLDAAGITDFGKLSYPSEKSAQVFGEMCIPFLWLIGWKNDTTKQVKLWLPC